MVYGAEAILPSDILHDSPRVAAYVEEDAELARQDALDLQEENWDLAAQRSAIYQQNLHRYHSRRVRHRSFHEGDLVLRLKQKKTHKLSPKWEGPFMVSKVLLNGSYYLVDIRELKDRPKIKKRKADDPDNEFAESTRPLNIAHLRPFYT